MKLTIMIDVSDDSQKRLAVQWIQDNKNKILTVYGNDGCGCCVDSYHIECNEDARPLPNDICCEDDWTTDGKNSCPELTVEEVIADITRHLPVVKDEG